MINGKIDLILFTKASFPGKTEPISKKEVQEQFIDILQESLSYTTYCLTSEIINNNISEVIKLYKLYSALISNKKFDYSLFQIYEDENFNFTGHTYLYQLCYKEPSSKVDKLFSHCPHILNLLSSFYDQSSSDCINLMPISIFKKFKKHIIQKLKNERAILKKIINAHKRKKVGFYCNSIDFKMNEQNIAEKLTRSPLKSEKYYQIHISLTLTSLYLFSINRLIEDLQFRIERKLKEKSLSSIIASPIKEFIFKSTFSNEFNFNCKNETWLIQDSKISA